MMVNGKHIKLEMTAKQYDAIFKLLKENEREQSKSFDLVMVSLLSPHINSIDDLAPQEQVAFRAVLFKIFKTIYENAESPDHDKSKERQK